MAGGIYTSANPGSTSRELAYQMRDCTPTFIFVAENCSPRLHDAAKSAGFNQRQIFLFDDLSLAGSISLGKKKPNSTASIQSWSTLFATAADGKKFSWEELETPELSDRTAVLLYSSGTTGLPKGVEVTHFNLVATTMQQIKMRQPSNRVSERRSICVLPMYHGLGLVYYIFVTPKLGCETYLMDRYDLESMLYFIDHFKITDLLLVPPIVTAMAKHSSARNGRYDLSSIRKVVAGAAPLGMEITRQFEELWSGSVRVRQAWGMSEYVSFSSY